MFTAVDKMFAAGIGIVVGYLVSKGFLPADLAASTEADLTALITGVITMIATYVTPNKKGSA